MTRAFVELALRTFWNRIVANLRRMRDPRYAVGALFGLLYFGWIFFRNHGASKVWNMPIAGDIRTDVVSVVFLAILLFVWALPGDSGGLEFSEAEIQFLFPAPLRRRDLLLYKIVRAQPQVMMSAAIFSFLGATRGKFVGLWITFSVLSVYMMLAALGRARLRLMGINFLVRFAIVAVITLALGALGYHVARGLTIDTHNVTPATIAKLVDGAFHHPAIRILLFVPRAFAGAVFPASMTMLLIACAVLLPFGAVLFFLADRLNVSFEESSLVRAQRRHERLQRMQDRRGGRHLLFKRARAPFRLGPTGRTETAIVWKNSVALMRMSSPMLVIIPLIFALLMGIGLWLPHTRDGVAVTLLMWTAILPFIGPNIFANDLRLDLPRLEVLKSYPMSGEGIVAGEIAAPLAVIAGLELLAIGCAWIFLAIAGKMSTSTGAQFAICALLLAVPVVALQLLIRNAVPVIFPAWAARTKEDPRGFVLTGQRLLLILGNVVVLGLALLPAAVVFVPSAFLAIKFFEGNTAFMAIMTTPAIAVIAAEVWLGVRFLGSRFEALDVSQEFDTVAV